MHVIVQSELAKMHALGCRAIEAPATQLIFGNIERGHDPNHYVVQRHRNRSCDLIAAANPGRTIDNNVFSGYNGVKPKKIPIADPSAIECGVSAIAIKVMWCATSQRFIRAKWPWQS